MSTRLPNFSAGRSDEARDPRGNGFGRILEAAVPDAGPLISLPTGLAARFHEFDARRWDNGQVWLRQ
ncbi:hypothetical protein OWS73_05565 [Burkholderia sp. 1B3(2022)]|uniref:hypothetical protein n=1 Tax=Burkholderia sp. 1B3(2022) TaxID=2997425 RepID=UPI002FCA92C5